MPQLASAFSCYFIWRGFFHSSTFQYGGFHPEPVGFTGSVKDNLKSKSIIQEFQIKLLWRSWLCYWKKN